MLFSLISTVSFVFWELNVKRTSQFQTEGFAFVFIQNKRSVGYSLYVDISPSLLILQGKKIKKRKRLQSFLILICNSTNHALLSSFRDVNP
jgi:hypothetical protein